MLATFGDEFYAGWPAVTENPFGQGFVYYIGTDPEPDFLMHFCRTLCVDGNVPPVLEGPVGVEVRRRSQKDRSFLFILNHNDDVAQVTLPDRRCQDMLTGQLVTGTLALPGFDVRIIEEL